MRAITLGRVGIVLLLGAGTAVLAAQQAPQTPPVTAADILRGLPADGSSWLTFGGNYTNQRHSPLTQITPANVSRLVPQWTFQAEGMPVARGFEGTPLMMDGVLYITG